MTTNKWEMLMDRFNIRKKNEQQVMDAIIKQAHTDK